MKRNTFVVAASSFIVVVGVQRLQHLLLHSGETIMLSTEVVQ